jgi:hypothetical protein
VRYTPRIDASQYRLTREKAIKARRPLGRSARRRSRPRPTSWVSARMYWGKVRPISNEKRRARVEAGGQSGGTGAPAESYVQTGRRKAGIYEPPEEFELLGPAGQDVVYVRGALCEGRAPVKLLEMLQVADKHDRRYTCLGGGFENPWSAETFWKRRQTSR